MCCLQKITLSVTPSRSNKLKLLGATAKEKIHGDKLSAVVITEQRNVYGIWLKHDFHLAARCRSSDRQRQVFENTIYFCIESVIHIAIQNTQNSLNLLLLRLHFILQKK